MSSFTRWLIGLAVTLGWFALAVASGDWWWALGGLVSIGATVLLDLPDTSSSDEDEGV